MKPFKPHKLPLEELDWTKFIRHIGDANRAVAKFDGLLQVIPNARVLLSPLSTKEAVLSSKIEGTQATLEEVLEFEANQEKTKKYGDIQEIVNYRDAMDMAIGDLNKTPLSGEIIRKIHRILLRGARGEGKSPGNFRTGSVFIGKEGLGREGAKYVPPDPRDMEESFSEFEDYINFNEKDVLVQLAIVHAQFEIIHPFWDGNGRTGRILMPLFLYHKKTLHTPMFYLSEYFELNRGEYYERLLNISKNGDWEGWIKFFLVAVEIQSTKNIEKVQEILKLYDVLKKRIENIPTPKHSIKVLDFLFSKPIFELGDFLKETGIQKMAALRILNFLLKEEILTDNGKRRRKMYSFPNLMDIIR